MINQLKSDLAALADPVKAKKLAHFFKTGPGDYGAGDQFIGVVVPNQRQIAQKYKQLPLSDLQKLLASPTHEHRLTALFILIFQFPQHPDTIYNFYLKNLNHINNWDLVDLSAPKIVGEYLKDQKDRRLLYKLVKSKNIWSRRIAVLATYPFIKNNDFVDALKLSEILLADGHDLIHKATGWMLREIGKIDLPVLLKFLDKNYHHMPRTMLRYSIEKLPQTQRQHYLVK